MGSQNSHSHTSQPRKCTLNLVSWMIRRITINWARRLEEEAMSCFKVIIEANY